MSDWFCDRMPVDSIPIDDRGAQYGDGLFETIAIRSGEPRLWNFHVERLRSGCERLGFAAPSAESLLDDLQFSISASGKGPERALAKIMVTSGRGARGYQRRGELQAITRIGIFNAPQYCAEFYRNGIKARLCQHRIATQPALAGIKSLNRLDQVLARTEWSDSSIFEGLMLDADDRLICGTMSNVFIGHGNSIATPELARCGVAGVMRRHLLSLFDKERIACEIRDIDVRELESADEIFIANSQFGVLPVRRIDTQRMTVGSVTRKVLQLAAANGIPECRI